MFDLVTQLEHFLKKKRVRKKEKCSKYKIALILYLPSSSFLHPHSATLNL